MYSVWIAQEVLANYDMVKIKNYILKKLEKDSKGLACPTSSSTPLLKVVETR